MELTSNVHLIVLLQSMFSMDPATLSSEFHEKAVVFVNDSFAALQSLQIPFMQVSPGVTLLIRSDFPSGISAGSAWCKNMGFIRGVVTCIRSHMRVCGWHNEIGWCHRRGGSCSCSGHERLTPICINDTATSYSSHRLPSKSIWESAAIVKISLYLSILVMYKLQF